MGARAGLSNYSGDLAEDHIMFAQTRWALGAVVRLHLNRALFVRGEIATVRLYGDDRHSPTHAWRKFKFTNQLLDGSVLLEYAPIRIRRDPVRGDAGRFFHLYFFSGPSLAYSRPRLAYYGRAEDLERYTIADFPEDGGRARWLFSAALGQGVRMIYGDHYCLGLEVGMYPAFSDLLDGVRLNGNPARRDWYYKVGLTFSYFLGRAFRPADDAYARFFKY
ncbi:MAG: hypothetical protein ACR2K1_11915 [Saprospiraceae bacterium]